MAACRSSRTSSVRSPRAGSTRSVDSRAPGRPRRRGGGIRKGQRARQRSPTRARTAPARRGRARSAQPRQESTAAWRRPARLPPGSGASRPRSRSRSRPATSRRRAAAAEFETLVDSYTIGGRRAPAFEAIVNVADGRIRSRKGTRQALRRSLRQARDGWSRPRCAVRGSRSQRLLLSLPSAGRATSTPPSRSSRGAGDVRADRRLARRGAGWELLGRQQTTRTFLFTDIVGSTKLLETLGNEKGRSFGLATDVVREQIVDAAARSLSRPATGSSPSSAPRSAVEAATRSSVRSMPRSSRRT